MRIFLILAGFAVSAFAADMTAFDAIKLLPREQRKNIARVEARDGTPMPERWHVLMHDPAAENGLKEFVIAGGAVVASRGVSQFVEKLTPEMVLWDLVKFDSDKAAKLVLQYAQANSVVAAMLNFELRKDGAEATPLWTITAFDVEGKQLGVVLITATRGAVVSHDGFPVEPGQTAPPRFSTSSNSQFRERPPVPRATPAPVKKPGLFNRLFRGGERPPKP